MQVQEALDGLVQLDAVDMLREGLLTALEPQVRSCPLRLVSECCEFLIVSCYEDCRNFISTALKSVSTQLLCNQAFSRHKKAMDRTVGLIRRHAVDACVHSPVSTS